FDDTNPATEDDVYVQAIQADVRWLGYDWGEHLHFASDYFETMYAYAESLVERGLAYVDSSSEAEIREARGTVKTPGTPTRDRDRTPAENLDLFRRMRAGEFPDGAHVLRARIDLASPNMLMRDPVLYRIRHAHHHRTGDTWCIYPLYDYAHCLEDALEHVTHSLCTLEFENNRELYDWVIEHCPVPSTPRQYEFARLNLDYTVMSKRKLLRLVQAGDVSGWDDPRMPTLAGLRRRGVTPEAIRSFCEMVGVAKADSRVDMGKLEFAIRDDLNHRAPRVLAVLRPLRVVLTNWPADSSHDAGGVETFEAPLWPRDVPREGSRPVPFSGEFFIDRDDFAEDPPKGFRRLVPGGAVRLRHAYVIHCDEVVKDEDGQVVELRCRFDPSTRSTGDGAGTKDRAGTKDGAGTKPTGALEGADVVAHGADPADGFGWKPAGTIHWVSAAHAVPAEVRLYDRLFRVPDPDQAAAAAAAAAGEAGGEAGSEPGDAGADGGAPDFRRFLHAESLETVVDALIEPWATQADPDTRFQFERLGYFWRDPEDGRGERPVFNRIVTLRDSWARVSAETSGTASPAASPAGDAASRIGPAGHPPELPPEVKARARALGKEFGIGEVDAGILARDPRDEAFYRAAVAAWDGPVDTDAGAGALANWFIHSLPPLRDGRELAALPFGPEEFAALVALVECGTLSSRGGTAVLEVLVREGGDPAEITRRMDLAQVSDDDALLPEVRGVVADHPDKAEAWRGGKSGLMGFFMGQLMRRTGGKADPERARTLLESELSAGGE
ncbi:MAG: glutamine--tRNA ligase/YqeY domain fusion protein, partial [Gemmatimonadales bacterium]